MRRYAKPIVVADDLGLLRGRTTGVVTLPRHLDWSGAADYDLDGPGRIVDLYRTVLIEATKPDDLHRFLDRTVLTRLWPSIWLSPELRRAWELRFPELRRTAPEASAA
ncbi:hypothetical protein [Actinoplanes sp. NPDC026670]|uniref:hypothetical protein n=1 Tax=Actinoplanes sp. NPDC026670 TaxID=3154700 RepID=UPI0033DCDC03